MFLFVYFFVYNAVKLAEYLNDLTKEDIALWSF